MREKLMQTDNPSAPPARFQSLDVLRGLNILVMLFVNDVSSVRGTPGWMKHLVPSTADGMTFVDVVFPAFLFIAGMSLPLALERRFARGDSLWAVLGHLLVRTLSLLVIGVLMVNTENISGHGLLDPRLWQLLMYAGVCLIWVVPSSTSQKMVWLRRIAGILLLVELAVLYRGEGESGSVGLQPQWWGILGLIGWAYLVTGGLYLVLRRNALGLASAVALLYCVYLADAAGFFGFLGGFNKWISIGSMLGSHAAVTVSGALLGVMAMGQNSSHQERMRTAVLFAGVLAGAAILLHSLHDVHQMFFYNKNAATPPWCLLSSAYTALIWVGLYWLIDMRGVKKGTTILSAAGQNALFAFILGPIAYTIFESIPLLLNGFDPWWGWLGKGFAIGFFRSVIFAAAAIWLTAFLKKRGLALRV
jgi:heparan-alpha-glucosaminide N-acetyltransferase